MSDGMNSNIRFLIDQFENRYHNISIKLDILPSMPEDRSSYITTLRQQIENGTGPDVFLLPTSEMLILDTPKEFTYRTIDPLFTNMEVAMRHEFFLDISKFYDSDIELKKEELVKSVMNAGVVEGARYVLPLRFELPVIYAFPEELEKIGIESSILDNSIFDLMDYALTQKNALFAYGIEHPSLAVFSDLIDYNNMNVKLSTETVRSYMGKYQGLVELIGQQPLQFNFKPSLEYPLDMQGNRKPLYIDQLNHVLNYLAIAKKQGEKLELYPLRSDNGDVIATVTYFGAISSKCKHSDVAYMFLRQFLSPDSQWEQTRKSPIQEQHYGLIEKGWPVRMHGSVNELWSQQKMQNIHSDFTEVRNYELSDEAIQALCEEINIVRFPFPTSFRGVLYSLNDFQNKNIPSNVSLDELSSNFIAELNQNLIPQ